MKVLMVSLEAPIDPMNGFRLPLRELLDHVARHDLDVRLVAYRLKDQVDAADPGHVLRPRPELSKLSRLGEALATTFARQPTSSRRFVEGLRAEVKRQVDEYQPDLIHIWGGRLAPLLDAAPEIPSVMTAMDADTLNVRSRVNMTLRATRFYLADEERRLASFQRRHFPRFDRVVMVTEEDAELIRGLAPGTRAVAIPNGVEIPKDFGVRHRAMDNPTVIFHGVLAYPPNVMAVRYLVRDIWPLVLEKIPDARLSLVGRRPGSDLQQLALEHGIDLIGEVPEVWPWLRGADVYVCPMTSGTGIKNKLLEAMAAGLPCVASTLAIQGIAAVDGEHLLVADGPEATAAALVSLLKDASARVRLGAAAHAHVARNRSWAANAEAYLAVYDELVGRR